MIYSRRAVLRGAGAAVLPLAGAATVTGSATAATIPDFDSEGVATADFPEQLLRDYQPAVAWSQAARDQLTNIYAWRATPSSAADTNLEALYYWFRYAGQRSFFGRFALGLFSELGPDSHFLDHEPVIVYRDPDTGDVEEVVMTGYHHLAAARSGDEIPLDTYKRDSPTHVRLQIVDPWHHFNFLDGDEATGMPIPNAGVSSWLDGVRDGWYADGVLDATAQEAVDDPYAMRERDMWWQEGSDDAEWAQKALDWPFFSPGELPSPAQADDDLRI